MTVALNPPDASPSPTPDDAAPPDDTDTTGAAEPEAGDSDDDILLTVCKEPDGGYRLIDGPKDDEAAEGEEPPEGGEATEGKVYTSKGELLKAILDILNEDKSSAGAEGGSEDQFQSGFADNTPAAPTSAPIPQKY